MRVARILVTYELIREALALPRETVITFIKAADFDTAEMTIQHPDLPHVDLSEGQEFPLINPTFRRQEPVVLDNWGIK